MKIEIDQSGKIEQTNLDTIIAISNNVKYTIIFKKKDKRAIKLTFRKFKLSKIYMPIVFAALVAIAIHESRIRKSVTIDTEYPGYEKFIRNHIKKNLKELRVRSIPVIKFKQVGKTSNAHDLAAKVARKKLKPNKTVTLSEVKMLCLPKKKSGNA